MRCFASAVHGAHAFHKQVCDFVCLVGGPSWRVRACSIVLTPIAPLQCYIPCGWQTRALPPLRMWAGGRPSHMALVALQAERHAVHDAVLKKYGQKVGMPNFLKVSF